MGRTFLSFAVVAALARVAAAQTDPASAAKTVEKGGEYWTSPAEFVAAKNTIVPGKRLLFWPADDESYDAARKRVMVRFRWMLLPGEKPFKKGQALKLTVLTSADPDFSAMTSVTLESGADHGIFGVTLPLEKCDCSGETDLVLFLGLKEPQSNLVQIKVRFERLANAPTQTQR
jgi:hypothetical protein